MPGAQNLTQALDPDGDGEPHRGGGRRGAKRGGGHGSRGGGGDRDVVVSKKMSWLLRHGAVKEGLKMENGGWVGVEDLLKIHTLRSLKVGWDEIQSITATNAKQRFQIRPLDTDSSDPSSTPPLVQLSHTSPSDPSAHLIRATQGHSLAVAAASLLTALSPADIPRKCPRLVVHGTDARAWAAIRASGGLKRMGRTHVHFARGLPGSRPGGGGSGARLETDDAGADGGLEKESAQRDGEGELVVSGMRASANVLVWVDVERSMAAGLKWWISANGVVLSEGNDDGLVGLEHVDRVEDRRTGEVIWSPVNPVN